MRKQAAYFILTALTVVSGLSAFSGPEVIYEPFDYPAGEIDKSQQGGIGFTPTGWDNTGTDPYDVYPTGLTLAGLPTAGLSAARTTAPGWAEMHRPISVSSQTNLLADNTTIWFSVLVNNRNYSDGNENGTLLIATGPLTDCSSKPPIMSGGSGIGMAFQTSDDIHGLVITNGVSAYSAGFLTVWVAPGNWDMVPQILLWARLNGLLTDRTMSYASST